MAAVLITLVAVLGAGGPSIATAVRDLSQSQRLLRLTQLNTSAIALSHALADERDAMAAYAAAGRTGEGVSQGEQAAVNRQAAELARSAGTLDTAGSADLVRVTGDLRTELDDVGHIRQVARDGGGSAKAVFDSYTPVIDALDSVSGALARELPDRASDPDTSAGPALTGAVTQASAEHGLLIAALDGRGDAADLVGAARVDRLREQAAFADFTSNATADARTRYAQIVTGSDVNTAGGYLDKLTAQPRLTSADRQLNTTAVDQALSTRINRMRAVQSSLAAADTTRLTSLRDQDVTALEIRAALVGLCALIALAIGVQSAHSVTRPLARLRRYAAELDGEPPTASDDEFAALALAVQRLGRETAAPRETTADQEAAPAGPDGDEELRLREAALSQQQAAFAREKDEFAALVESRRGAAHHTFAGVSRRGLTLVERQLQLIEGMENREQDPDELRTLFRLDHLATRMRRNSESLLVLAGADTGADAPGRPVPLVDVVRAAISEIEHYERVRVPLLPRAQLAGFAADDAGHLMAELLENATAFSPPQTEVRVSGWLLENGEVMISVEDQGTGLAQDRLNELNRLLADPRDDESAAPAALGLFVAGRLAARHGIRVELRAREQGGVAAVVILPATLTTSTADADRAAPEATAARPGPAVAAAHAPDADPEHARPYAAEPAVGDPSAHPVHDHPVQRPAPAPNQPPAPAAPVPEAAPAGGLLPKRVPRSSGLAGDPETRAASPSVDAAELRRKLGGFAQGLRDGRRDAWAEATGPTAVPLPAPRTTGDHSDSEPSEEARG